MLMKDPFEPASAMAFTAFRSFRLTWAEVPDSSRAVFSTFFEETTTTVMVGVTSTIGRTIAIASRTSIRV